MSSMTDRLLALTLCAGMAFALIACPTLARAEDHPEHPAGSEHPEHPEKSSKEHPEHPEKSSKEHPEHPTGKKAMTLDALEKAIVAYIETDSKLKGGYFLVFDTVDKKPLALKLDKVHKDKLATLGDGVYFACTDLKAADGTVYDLDFFMKNTAHGIKTTEVAVHKKSGKPRYTWYEEDGIWKKKSL